MGFTYLHEWGHHFVTVDTESLVFETHNEVTTFRQESSFVTSLKSSPFTITFWCTGPKPYVEKFEGVGG